MRNICIVYSNISNGNMNFRFGSEEVNKNRTNFFQKIRINADDLVILKLKHKDNVQLVSKRYGGTILQGDALITKERGLFLGILTADCLPITLYDPVNNTIALVHVSIKNYPSIISKAIKTIIAEFDSNPRELKIEIGPSIGPCHYKLDLWKETEKILTGLGVKKKNISNLHTCTYESNYFSHRRSEESAEKEGRFLTIVGLK